MKNHEDLYHCNGGERVCRSAAFAPAAKVAQDGDRLTWRAPRITNMLPFGVPSLFVSNSFGEMLS